MKTVELRALNVQRMTVTIDGVTPLIQNKWSEKALRTIGDKKKGESKRHREKCDPEAEFRAATYHTASGGYGVPAGALKKCIAGAAHKDIGVEKTLIRKSLFIVCDDPNNIVEMDCDEPEMRTDTVRVGVSQTDLRYRPQFTRWSIPITFEYNADNITQEVIVNLLNLAGFGVGIGEWRPEKDGEFGRFEVRVEGE